MSELDVADLLRQTLLVTVKLGGPPLMVGLLVGLVVSFVQAVTQINEATLAFLPKVIAGLDALSRNGLRYPIAPYGVNTDARAGMGVSYSDRK